MKKLFLVLAALSGMMALGCPDAAGTSSPEPQDIAVQFTSLAADGSATATTVKLRVYP